MIFVADRNGLQSELGCALSAIGAMAPTLWHFFLGAYSGLSVSLVTLRFYSRANSDPRPLGPLDGKACGGPFTLLNVPTHLSTSHRFQNPCDGMRNARLKREDAFSQAMIIVSSAIVSHTFTVDAL
jgi:hypothetical protein